MDELTAEQKADIRKWVLDRVSLADGPDAYLPRADVVAAWIMSGTLPEPPPQ